MRLLVVSLWAHQDIDGTIGTLQVHSVALCVCVYRKLERISVLIGMKATKINPLNVEAILFMICVG